MTWVEAIGPVTIYVADLDAATRFYERVFDVTAIFHDEVSSVYRIGSTILNVLSEREAPELIEPAAVAPAGTGSRVLFTLAVDDVDARVAALAQLGVTMLNGPQDRSWGIRTAAFADPDGHVWELSGPLRP